MTDMYFIRSTLLNYDPSRELYWETGHICFVKEDELFDCFCKLIDKTNHGACDGYLLTTVGTINGIKKFKHVDLAETVDIVFNTKKCDGPFDFKHLSNVIDTNLDFGMLAHNMDKLVFACGIFFDFDEYYDDDISSEHTTDTNEEYCEYDEYEVDSIS